MTDQETVHRSENRALARQWNHKKWISNFFSYALLILIALVMILPFLWTLSTSLKGQNEEIYSMPPSFIPEHLTFENYQTVWTSLPIPTYFMNSIIISFFGVALPLILASLAAYPLARMQFKGKNLVFILIVATMMIPFEVTMIPIYLILNEINLTGTLTGVILPGAVSAYGIFLMRQGMISIPKEVEESAIMDGASVWRIWVSIMMPMVQATLATLGILSFIGAWNNFIWPMIVLDDSTKYPLTVGLYKLKGTFVSNTRLVAAGSMIAMLPIMIVFIAFQKYFIKGVNAGAVKG